MKNLIFVFVVAFLCSACASTSVEDYSAQSISLLRLENGMTPKAVLASLPPEAQIISRVDDEDLAMMRITFRGKARTLWFPNGKLTGIQGPPDWKR